MCCTVWLSLFLLLDGFVLHLSREWKGALTDIGRVQEAESELLYSAQLRCADYASYTTIDTTLTYQGGVVGNYNSKSLLKIPANSSGVVVLATLREAVTRTSPSTLTHASTGLSEGLTNGTAKGIMHYVSSRPNPMLPFKHPRQNMSFCAGVAKNAVSHPTNFYSSMLDTQKLSYVRILENGIIHKNGYVGLHCGWIQPRMGCCNRVLIGARQWWTNITNTIITQKHVPQKYIWSDVNYLSLALEERQLPVYDTVFVISAFWDFNYHHFLHESLPRLVHFYPFLQRNKEIYIHVMAEEDYFNMSLPSSVERAKAGKEIRQRVFDLLLIPAERIITGEVIARTVYLPNDIECGSSFRHAAELRLLSQLLRKRAAQEVRRGVCEVCDNIARHVPASSIPKRAKLIQDSAQLRSAGATVLLQSRPCPLTRYNPFEPHVYANNTRFPGHWRCMTQIQMDTFMHTLPAHFPGGTVILAGETRQCNLSVPLSLCCDIALYQRADIVIGLHGAALTNVMFMRPGTVLVEIVGGYDGRMIPVCGIYGPLAAVFGVHHYIYYYDGVLDPDSLNIPDVVMQARKFYEHIGSRSAQ